MDLSFHPAIVHLPIGIAMVLPLVAGYCAWRAWSSPARSANWALVPVLAVIAFGAGKWAEETGEEVEELVEAYVDHELIHHHEEAGELFVLLAGITCALALAAFVLPSEKARRVAMAMVLISALATAGCALRAGADGGEIVHEHGVRWAVPAGPGS